MPTLVVRHPDGTQTEHELASSLTIGRAEGNDLVLSQGGVSRKHATVSNEGGSVFVEDHASANGTFVDGEKIPAKTKLGPRAQIVIGDYELSMKSGADSAAAAPTKKPGASGQKPAVAKGPGSAASTSVQPAARAAPPRATRVVPSVKPGAAAGLAKRPAGAAPAAGGRPGAGGAAGAHLKGITGPWANKVYPIRGKIVVGRVAGVQVVVEDDSVSRRHAEIEKSANGIVIRDLGSANGTMLNGSQLAPNEEVALNTGDVVQFGVIEMSFEAGDADVMNAPTRRGGGPARGAAPATSGGGGGVGAKLAAMDPMKKKIMFGGIGAGVLLLVGVVAWGSGGEDPLPVNNGGDGAGGEVVLDEKSEIEAKVSECRTYSATDLVSTEPDWVRAEAACQFVLNLEPIHQEATTLIRKIKVEKEAYEFYKAAEKLMRVQREEEALDQYAKIPEESGYFRKVRTRVKETVDSVKKRTAEDCKTQVRSRFYSSALPRCEKYMQIACCEMSSDQLAPPPGYRVVLDGKLGKDGWRPNDPIHVAYLRAKKEAAPEAGPFECPNTRIFCRVEVEGPSPKKDVDAYIKSRYTEKLIQVSMMAYWEGRDQEAVVQLQRLREMREKAAFHKTADDLLADIRSVIQLFKLGEGLLQQEKKAMDADEPFKAALEIDARLMQEMTDKRPSFYRRNINADMAQAAYKAGDDWAKKKDRKKACGYWKIGYAYSKVDPELLRGIGFCSTWAAEALKEESCEMLNYAEDLAVDGDGIKAKVDLMRAELKCPGR